MTEERIRELDKRMLAYQVPCIYVQGMELAPVQEALAQAGLGDVTIVGLPSERYSIIINPHPLSDLTSAELQDYLAAHNIVPTLSVDNEVSAHQLASDELPRHDFGVGIYGGVWPDGEAVELPCCQCQRFSQCDNVRHVGRDHKQCFIARDDQ